MQLHWSRNMVLREQLTILRKVEEAQLSLLAHKESELRRLLDNITKLETSLQRRMKPELHPLQDLKGVSLTQENIDGRIKELAHQIASSGAENPILLGVLDGALPFFAKLQEALISNHPEFLFEPETTSVTSYDGEKSTGKREIRVDPKWPVGNRKIFIVEDLIESGGTLQDLSDYLIKKLGAQSVEVVVLLNKVQEREKFSLVLNYVGFEVSKDAFVLGYGMDRDGLFRTLSGIWSKGSGDATLEEKAMLRLKGPLNTQLQNCLSSQQAAKKMLEDYEKALIALTAEEDALSEAQRALDEKSGRAASQSLGANRDTMFSQAHRITSSVSSLSSVAVAVSDPDERAPSVYQDQRSNGTNSI